MINDSCAADRNTEQSEQEKKSETSKLSYKKHGKSQETPHRLQLEQGAVTKNVKKQLLKLNIKDISIHPMQETVLLEVSNKTGKTILIGFSWPQAESETKPYITENNNNNY